MSAIDQYLAGRSLQIASPNGGRPTFRTVNQFNQTYWNGLDAAIYFDDLYIGEVIALHYEEQEAVYPLFSYADYVKRGAIHGARRVMGQFTLNFQQALMMYLVLEHLRNGNGTLAPEERFIAAKNFKPVQLTPSSPPQGSAAAKATAVGLLTPEAVSRMSELTAGEDPAPKAQLMTKAVHAVKGHKLKHITLNAQRLREQFRWANPVLPVLDKPGATLLTAVQNSLAAQGFQSKYDVFSGFTIGIVLGETDLNKYQRTFNTPSSVLVPTDFDDAYFQAAAHLDKSDVAGLLRELPPATVTQITGVDVTGHGMSYDDSGRPLLQTYSFIASDVTTPQNVI